MSDGPYNIRFDERPTESGPGSAAGRWLLIFFFVSALPAALLRSPRLRLSRLDAPAPAA